MADGYAEWRGNLRGVVTEDERVRAGMSWLNVILMFHRPVHSIPLPWKDGAVRSDEHVADQASGLHVGALGAVVDVHGSGVEGHSERPSQGWHCEPYGGQRN